MHIIATASDGWQFAPYVMAALVACAGPAFLAAWVRHGRRVYGVLGALALAAYGTLAVAYDGGEWLALIGVAAGLAVYARAHLARVGRNVVAALLVVAGLPIYAVTLLAIAIMAASFGCAPDAYECPL
jgi:acyl CoA:acetate/3-ketoacid CoA transferase beta subunit